MRQARVKIEGAKAYYHCVSRVGNREFLLGEDEKEYFVKLMRRYEKFCGVRVVTFCVMTNHFHILVEVPERPPTEAMPTDEELVALVKGTKVPGLAAALRADLERFRQEGQSEAAEALRARYLERMWDVSWFMRLLKGRFTQWFNKRKERTGHLWEDRFKSVLVEGRGRALVTMAAYIDLNPVRAGMVEDPKDYRWSGFGEAMAGNKVARGGLAVAAGAVQGIAVAANRVMAEYRLELYAKGEQQGLDRSAAGAGEHGRAVEQRPVARKGVSRERVAEVYASKGKLSAWEALGCRVRYFSDGVVLGSKAFVEEHFERERWRYGPKRTSGARKMRYVDLPDLCTMRDLQKAPVGPR